MLSASRNRRSGRGAIRQTQILLPAHPAQARISTGPRHSFSSNPNQQLDLLQVPFASISRPRLSPLNDVPGQAGRASGRGLSFELSNNLNANTINRSGDTRPEAVNLSRTEHNLPGQQSAANSRDSIMSPSFETSSQGRQQREAVFRVGRKTPEHVCPTCKYKLDSKHNLEQHIKKRVEGTSYPCTKTEACERSFCTQKAASMHACDPDKPKPPRKKTRTPNMYTTPCQCPDCPYIATCTRDLDNHTRKKDKKLHLCEYCQRLFCTASSMWRHRTLCSQEVGQRDEQEDEDHALGGEMATQRHPEEDESSAEYEQGAIHGGQYDESLLILFGYTAWELVFYALRQKPHHLLHRNTILRLIRDEFYDDFDDPWGRKPIRKIYGEMWVQQILLCLARDEKVARHGNSYYGSKNDGATEREETEAVAETNKQTVEGGDSIDTAHMDGKAQDKSQSCGDDSASLGHSTLPERLDRENLMSLQPVKRPSLLQRDEPAKRTQQLPLASTPSRVKPNATKRRQRKLRVKERMRSERAEQSNV